VLTCGLILNLERVMLIIFSGLPFRPYVALYMWVNVVVGVPIKMFRSFIFNFNFNLRLTLNPTRWNSVRAYILYDVTWGSINGLPLEPIPVGRHKIVGSA
jgi:hypothetical protein